MNKLILGENYDAPIVLCLGFFDCMHKGHVSLLNEAKQLAGSRAQTALFTFSNNHFATLGNPSKLIYTFEERQQLYQSLGVQTLLSANFDDAFKSLSGQQFLSMLCRYNLMAVVCGEDYTCGSDRKTAVQTAQFLKDVCPVHIVPTLKQNGEKVSSTLVRKLLSQNKVEEANSLLSQPFFFCGTVQQGRHVGHQLGFPTANVDIAADKLAPQGVYAGIVTVDKPYKAIVNVGATPTFHTQTPKVEAHLLNFDGDLYGKQVKISLVRYLRPILTFQNGQQLAQQLKRDIEVANDQIRP